MKFFEGFPKVKDYTSSKAFWLPLMLGYILNLSPFLEFYPFHFWGFHFDFLWPVFLDCFRLDFSFALSLLGASLDLIAYDFCHSIWAIFSIFQLKTHLMDSNIGSHLA